MIRPTGQDRWDEAAVCATSHEPHVILMPSQYAGGWTLFISVDDIRDLGNSFRDALNAALDYAALYQRGVLILRAHVVVDEVFEERSI